MEERCKGGRKNGGKKIQELWREEGWGRKGIYCIMVPRYRWRKVLGSEYGTREDATDRKPLDGEIYVNDEINDNG